MRDYTAKGPKKVIQINEKELQQHLSTLVTDTVQEVLNQVLDAEADEMVGAARYERSADRQDYRSGSYTRKLQTKAGEVELNIPKLREQTLPISIKEAKKKIRLKLLNYIQSYYIQSSKYRENSSISRKKVGKSLIILLSVRLKILLMEDASAFTMRLI